MHISFVVSVVMKERRIWDGQSDKKMYEANKVRDTDTTFFDLIYFLNNHKG